MTPVEVIIALNQPPDEISLRWRAEFQRLKANEFKRERVLKHMRDGMTQAEIKRATGFSNGFIYNVMKAAKAG